MRVWDSGYNYGITGIARADELHDEIKVTLFGLKIAARR